jgi:hypothetical protein
MKAELDTLIDSVAKTNRRRSLDTLKKLHEASKLQFGWIEFLSHRVKGTPGEVLLTGAHSAVIEAAACVAVGFFRPALTAMRCQIDLFLGTAYYESHEVEWKYYNETGDQFRLKSDLVDYFKKYNQAYKTRFSLLYENRSNAARLGKLDIYGILSAHVHAMGVKTKPSATRLAEVIQEIDPEQIVALQRDVAESVSDYLACWYHASWNDLPKSVKDNVFSRLSEAQQTKFFAQSPS